VVGHIYPIYYKFKGGKGIATTFGVFMVADPISTLILFGI
jgi:glycerol-3-phosphate acyltransferase PlsY